MRKEHGRLVVGADIDTPKSCASAVGARRLRHKCTGDTPQVDPTRGKGTHSFGAQVGQQAGLWTGQRRESL